MLRSKNKFVKTCFLYLTLLLAQAKQELLKEEKISISRSSILRLDLNKVFDDDALIKSNEKVARISLRGKEISSKDFIIDFDEFKNCRQIQPDKFPSDSKYYIFTGICNDVEMTEFKIEKKTSNLTIKKLFQFGHFPKPFYLKHKDFFMIISKNPDSPNNYYYSKQNSFEKFEEAIPTIGFDSLMNERVGFVLLGHQSTKNVEFILYEQVFGEFGEPKRTVLITKNNKKEIPFLTTIEKMIKFKNEEKPNILRIIKMQSIIQNKKNYVLILCEIEDKANVKKELILCEPNKILDGLESCGNIKEVSEIGKGQIRFEGPDENKLIYFGTSLEDKEEKLIFWSCELDFEKYSTNNCKKVVYNKNDGYFYKISSENFVDSISKENGVYVATIVNKNTKLPVFILKNIGSENSKIELYEDQFSQLIFPLKEEVLIFEENSLITQKLPKFSKTVEFYPKETKQTKIDLKIQQNSQEINLEVELLDDIFEKKN